MSTYVISDIHGQYDMFMELLDKIQLQDADTLYILGDIVDRGPNPIKTVMKLMEMPNAVCMVGNHEFMMMDCMRFLMKEITDKTIGILNSGFMMNFLTWQQNGNATTMAELSKLDRERKVDVIDFLSDLSLYEELSVEDKDYLLVHAGLGNFSPDKDIDDYAIHDLIWERADYNLGYFPDKYLITGHTPTQTIKNNPKPGYIYRNKNHMAIDCGACFPGGRLAAICLDTGEEFYSSTNNI